MLQKNKLMARRSRKQDLMMTETTDTPLAHVGKRLQRTAALNRFLSSLSYMHTMWDKTLHYCAKAGRQWHNAKQLRATGKPA